MLTDYECYRKMTWTTDSDECEEGCGVIMAEGRCVVTNHGHYCSHKCRRAHEDAMYTSGTDREDFHSDI